MHAEEMIYDDVENGDDGGNSSLDYGWSSSEFESYEEQSDSECKNGVPSSFLRGNHKRHVCNPQQFFSLLHVSDYLSVQLYLSPYVSPCLLMNLVSKFQNFFLIK